MRGRGKKGRQRNRRGVRQRKRMSRESRLVCSKTRFHYDISDFFHFYILLKFSVCVCVCAHHIDTNKTHIEKAR